MKKLLLIFALLFCVPAFAQVNNGNTSCVPLTLVARTASANSADLNNTQWRGAHFIITTTSLGVGVWTPRIQGKDSVSGNYYDLLVGATLSTGTQVLKIYPGIATGATAVSDILPRIFRFQMTATASPVAGTFSVGCSLIM